MVKRGEIRWYKFNRPDKRRPVLILTRESHLEYLNEVTVASVTSVIRDIPSQVILGKNDGMPKPCAISLDHVRTVAKDKLGGLITTVGPAQLQKVRDALLYALGF